MNNPANIIGATPRMRRDPVANIKSSGNQSVIEAN
jgi:hypothetical protein